MGSDASRRPPRFRSGRILRSVRFKIILLLLVPLVSLSALWAFAASITLGDGLNLRHVNTIQEHLGYPAGALGSALEQERRLSMVFLGSKTAGDRAAMESGRLATDRQADLFRRLASDENALNAATPQARQWVHEVLRHLNDLPARRRAIDAAAVTREQVFTGYNDTVQDVIALQSSLATLSDPEITKDAENDVALTRAREILSQEDALLSGALAADRLTFAEHVQFTKLVGAQRTLYRQTLPELRDPERAYYQRIVSTPEYGRLQSLEDRFTDHMPPVRRAAVPGRPARDPLAGLDVTWKTTVSSVLTRFRGLELSATANAADRAKPIADKIILRVVLAGALGLVAVIASLVLSLWVGRSVIRDLTGLRRAALDLANERLPSVIRRLRRGEDVDVAAEAPPLSFGTEEIDQVGQAFNAARRTAVQGAVEEAALRRGINEVFLNLARRNQTLLHRQLSLLDSMERRVTEPDELEDLFRLDHLATRMRRHAEGLIILSGQAPGRGWRNPVPAVDVARAAAAEVEDYARVTVTTMPRVSIAGPAVADLIHLLAELIENATMFSPPDTGVQVSGQIVAHGFAIEVEDRGLSMDAASIERANERLAEPPEFDLSNSAQLGLIVVGRLAQRHRIQVTLRTSPYGGTTAIVLLPDAIVVRGQEQAELGPGPLAATRRGQDVLTPIGAIGPPSHPNGTADTGPMQLTPGDRPPLPRRHADTGPQTGHYHPRPYDPQSYGASTGSYGGNADARDTETFEIDFGADGTEGGDHDAYTRGSYTQDSYTREDGHGGHGTAGRPGDGHGGGYGPEAYDAGPYASGDTGAASYALDSDAPGSVTDLRGAYGHGTDEWPARQGERPPLPRRHADPGGTAGAPSGRSVFEPAVEPGAEPAPPAEPDAGNGTGDASTPTPSGGKPPLPRRVRQANLAPQLREEVELLNNATDNERSPEELRTMLSSIQKGWLRGRSDAEQAATHHEEEDI